MEMETVERVVALLAENPIAEIEVSDGTGRVRIARGAVAAAPSAPDAALADGYTADGSAGIVDDIDDETSTVTITAELVGIFHHASPPVHHGTPVAEGQLLGSLEAMKLMNDVKAPAPGRIAEVMIEEHAPVGYGQPLFRIDLA